MILLNNTRIQNRYLIVRLLGKGGFGAVYEAIDERLGHRVALKQLTLGSPQAMQAFEREARILAHLDHTALPKVSDYFVYSNHYFLVMQYIEGDDFRALLRERTIPFPVEQVLEWADQLLYTLEYLHGQQPPVIHRDIKPANIKLSPEGKIYLLDFGISKGGQTHTYQARSARSIQAFSPRYASIEQIEGKGTDARSDLYSLAVTLHYLLSNQRPPKILSHNTGNTMNRADPLPPVNQLNPQVPVKVAQVLTRALNFDPDLRPQSALAMRQMLKDAIAPPPRPPIPPIPPIYEPPTSRALPWLVGVGVLLLLLGLVSASGFFGGESDPTTTPLPTSSNIPLPSNTPLPIPSNTPLPIPSATPLPTSPPIPPTPELVPGATRIAQKDGMVQLYVPAGNFEMGSAEDDPDASEDEKPRRTIYLDGFFIDQTEITNAKYAQCVADAACEAPRSNESSTRESYYGNAEFNNYPVIHVSWQDAKAYCQWAERRLPTEAQWEKAAGGTDGRQWPWGNDTPNDSLANFDINEGDTTRVGSYNAGISPYGAHDMAGNVWEWVFDEYKSNNEDASAGSTRVLRGGAWDVTERDIRVRNRNNLDGSTNDEQGGIRCASSP